MAVTEVTICNSALIKIGAERILSLDDNTARAKILKEIYPIVRDDMIASHPWNFATDRVVLAALVTAPLYEWDYQFQLPSNCLRVYGTDIDPEPWKVEDGKLLCNFSEVTIKFIKQVTDTSKFSSYFVEAFACRLAAEIAYAITQSTTLKDSAEAKYERQLRVARSFDAQESMGDRVYADNWLNSRA